MRRSWLCIPLVGLAGCAAPAAPPGAPAPPPAEEAAAPCAGAAHRAFDFWIGEWDVYTTGTDELRGRSTIASTDGGCVITERFTSTRGPYSGRSVNIYDRETGRWEQFWVDNQGDLIHFVGGPTESGMQLTDEADITPGADEPAFARMTFTANPDGTVRQHGEASGDEGASWETRYDLTYRPSASAEHDPPPAREGASPCAGAAHRAFDFWIGEWDVSITGADEVIARSSIASTDDGCVVTERFTSGAYSGRSLNIYDRETERWEQFWVDSQGDLIHFVGGPTAEGGMQLVDEADITPGAEEPVFSRLTFAVDPDGSVRQHGETSGDQGAGWETVVDLTYRRRGAAP